MFRRNMLKGFISREAEMPKVLSAQQIEHFHGQGFLKGIPVLSQAEVAHYRGCLESFERRYPNDVKKLKSKSHILCPWVADMARNPNILDIYEDLIGPNILCYSMAFRVKDPDGKTFAGWHQDGAANPIKPILVIGALALADCSLAHGCLKVIPGSHKSGVLPHIDTGNPDSILSRGQFISSHIDESKAVNLELKAGEIGLFNAGIIHSSPVNTSDARRIVVLVEMIPAHTEVRAYRDSAMLVRGVDAFNNVDVDPAPSAEFGPEERAAWRLATMKVGKNIFEGSPLPPTAVYAGQPTN
ncbi:MAG: phytanoyl-CoA dioxygenase family protein [Proteobacteria bacterium]|nr:phytanoyl-CoA dioxygenase family protein [Pseudomonadota bacterium]